ncbi:YycH family regulatory protein [Salipaludibacillus sp. HK11]|uniref:YycH family regulatory protein n=1 Tax=Salipaludibacillus sp. HK11 TaxID=3394320 RepID=UPI0039FC459C
MIIENIKTAILWILILTSVGLTWEIWTYTPAYNELEESGEGYVEIEAIGDSRSLLDVLYPNEVLVHNEEQIYLIHPTKENYEELDDLLESVNIEFINPVAEPSSRAPSLDRFYNGIEIVFDQAIKGDWLNQLFTVEEENIPIEYVNRIIFMENNYGDEVRLQFVDTENEEIYESARSISKTDLEAFYNDTENDRASVEKKVFQQKDNSEFQPVRYVVTEPMTLRKFTYESQDLSVQAFSQILFPEPEFVRRIPQGRQGETFTDGKRMMTIQESGSILKFERPDSGGQQTPMLEDGLEFINSHSGWTGDYYAERWRESSATGEATFRLHVGGFPVLGSNMNDDQLYTIHVSRADSNQITEYTRPMFKLGENPFEIESNVRLQPFDVLEQHIFENEIFDMDSVEDIKIGHNMIRERSFATFEPAWYVKVRGRWTQVDISSELSQGGIENGLE